MLTVVADGCPGHEGGKDRSPSLIDEIVREGARRMLAEALRAEVDAYIAQFTAERGDDGRHQTGAHRTPRPMAAPSLPPPPPAPRSGTTSAGRCSLTLPVT